MAILHMHNKSMHYNPYLWTNRRNFRILEHFSVKEVDGNIKFQIWSKNTIVSCMRNERL